MWGHAIEDHAGNILSFTAGNDKADAVWVKPNPLPSIVMTNDALHASCNMAHLAEAGTEEHAWLVREMQQLVNDRDILQGYRTAMGNDSYRALVHVPLHLPTLLMEFTQKQRRLQQMRPAEENERDRLRPAECVRMLEACIQGLYSKYQLPTSFEFRHTDLEAALRYHLCSRHVVLNYGFSRSTFEALLTEIDRLYRIRLVAPGSTLGVQAAHSVCEGNTQSTISSFHQTGMHSFCSERVQSLESIINLTDFGLNSSMTIFPRPEYFSQVDTCCAQLPARHLRSIAKFSIRREALSSLMDVDLASLTSDDDAWLASRPAAMRAEWQAVQDYFNLIDPRKWTKANCSQHVVRIEIDPAKARALGLTLEAIVDRCEATFRTKQMHFWVHSAQADAQELASSGTTGAAAEAPWVLRLFLGARSNLHKQFLLAADRAQDVTVAVEDLGRYVLDTVLVHGVSGILEAYVGTVDVNRRNPETGAIETRKQPTIFTKGTNLRRVLGLPWVDETRTYTSDVKDTVNELGIEAGYHSIYKALQKSIESQGAFVLPRHPQLIARFMTHRA